MLLLNKSINFSSILVILLRGATDLWELAGIGYCSGQFFYLKYLQMYGIHSLIAHLDGMTPPKQPKCITRELFSDFAIYCRGGECVFCLLIEVVDGLRNELMMQTLRFT